jgi:predicted ester cyclase
VNDLADHLSDCQKKGRVSMSAEENKAAILQMFETVEQAGPQTDVSMFDPACRFPDMAFYGLPPTLDGYQQFMEAATGAFSDFHNIIEVIVAEGDTVMVWGTQRSIHTGLWRSIPATNRQVSYRFVECYRLEGGKIVEFRLLIDSLSFLQQVGAFPSPNA